MKQRIDQLAQKWKRALTSWQMGLAGLAGTATWLFSIPSPLALIEGVLWYAWIAYLLLLVFPVLLSIHIRFVLARDWEPYRGLWQTFRAFFQRRMASNTATREIRRLAFVFIMVGSVVLLALLFDKNLFEAREENAHRDVVPSQQSFMSSPEQHVSSAPQGKVTFDYSSNNGRYSIGTDPYLFETKWSKANDQRIHAYSDPPSIHSLSLVKDKQEISAIDDARMYDGSSRVRSPGIGQIMLLKNTNGFFAALKILAIKDDTRGSPFDELTFEYIIQTDGTPDFTELS